MNYKSDLDELSIITSDLVLPGFSTLGMTLIYTSKGFIIQKRISKGQNAYAGGSASRKVKIDYIVFTARMDSLTSNTFNN